MFTASQGLLDAIQNFANLNLLPRGKTTADDIWDRCSTFFP